MKRKKDRGNPEKTSEVKEMVVVRGQEGLITLTSPACSVHFPFGNDAMIICTLSSRSIRLGS